MAQLPLLQFSQAQPDLLVDLSSDVRFGILAASPIHDPNHSLSLTPDGGSTTTSKIVVQSVEGFEPLQYLRIEPEITGVCW